MSVNRVLLGLIGANIMGSLSPPLFADAFKVCVGRRFLSFDGRRSVTGRRLPQLLDAMKMLGFYRSQCHLSVQQEILPLLDKVRSRRAAQSARINTVAIAPGCRTTGL